MTNLDDTVARFLTYASTLADDKKSKIEDFTDFEQIEKAASQPTDEKLLMTIIDPLKDELLGTAASYAALGRVSPQQFIPNFYPKI